MEITERDTSPLRCKKRPNVRALVQSAAVSLVVSGALCFAQDARDALPTPPQAPRQTDPEAPSFTFKAVTRMVIVEVVARDSEDNPVRNLTAGDLRVSERMDGSNEIPEKIASFRPVNDAVAAPAASTKGIVLSWLHKSFCPGVRAFVLSLTRQPQRWFASHICN